MTFWLVRKGFSTFPWDLETNGDDGIDEVFFELLPSERKQLDDSRFGLSQTPDNMVRTTTREQYCRVRESR